MNWKTILAVGAVLLSGTLSAKVKHSEFACEQTGVWRLSDGTVIDTPLRFDVDYMMEMFLACDYEKALAVLGPEGVQPVPVDLGGGFIAATCVL